MQCDSWHGSRLHQTILPRCDICFGRWKRSMIYRRNTALLMRAIKRNYCLAAIYSYYRVAGFLLLLLWNPDFRPMAPARLHRLFLARFLATPPEMVALGRVVCRALGLVYRRRPAPFRPLTHSNRRYPIASAGISPCRNYKIRSNFQGWVSTRHGMPHTHKTIGKHPWACTRFSYDRNADR